MSGLFAKRPTYPQLIGVPILQKVIIFLHFVLFKHYDNLIKLVTCVYLYLLCFNKL